MLFGEGFAALVAAEALEAVAVRPNRLQWYGSNGRSWLISPLALSGEKSHTIYGSRAWVTPRFGFAPPPVTAGSGALMLRVRPVGSTVISTV